MAAAILSLAEGVVFAAGTNHTDVVAAAGTNAQDVVQAMAETNRLVEATSATNDLSNAAGANAGTNRMAIGFAEYSLAGNMLAVADIADPAAPLDVCHFDIGGFAPEVLSATNGILRVEGPGGFAEFDISDIFAPEPVTSPTNSATLVPAIPTASDHVPLALSACGWDGVRIFRAGPDDDAGEQVTRCLTEGPALAVAAVPGGFAVVQGTRGYALYCLDDAGLVTLIRHWPLETGRAVSAAYDPATGEVAFDCQEGGVRLLPASEFLKTECATDAP